MVSVSTGVQNGNTAMSPEHIASRLSPTQRRYLVAAIALYNQVGRRLHEADVTAKMSNYSHNPATFTKLWKLNLLDVTTYTTRYSELIRGPFGRTGYGAKHEVQLDRTFIPTELGQQVAMLIRDVGEPTATILCDRCNRPAEGRRYACRRCARKVCWYCRHARIGTWVLCIDCWDKEE